MKNGKIATPQCTAACPAGIDVPSYVRHIREGNFNAALAVVRDKIPFPSACGYACVHPCESKCARVQYDEPVAIRLLKRAAVEHSDPKWPLADGAPATGKKVAVVGAGPCGLTAAYYLAILGHEVTVYEAQAEPGGMLRYGIPEYRLPNYALAKEISVIAEQGVKIITNTRVSSIDELLSQGYDSVLVTVGAWKGYNLHVSEENNERVIDGITFLRNINSGESYPGFGPKVVVVGGGNTAIDAARASLRQGAEVTILYRRTIEEMPASPEEIQDAFAEGVQFEFLAAPVEVADNTITCVRMALGHVDESGRPKPVPIEGSEFDVSYDNLILAIGQGVDSDGFNLSTNKNGTFKVDPDNCSTDVEAVFAAGDAVTGPSSIIEAIAQGRKASVAVDKFLGGAGEIDFSREKGNGVTIVPQEAPRGTSRKLAEHAPVSERLEGFNIVEKGYDVDTAIEEAGRCLSCDLRDCTVEVNTAICKGCGYCKEVCTLEIFQISDAFNQQGYKPAEVVAVEKCIGCLKCLYICPDFAINIGCSR